MIFKYIIRILFSCLILVYISGKVDWRIIAEILSRTDMFWYFLSTGVMLVCAFIATAKFHRLIRKTHLSLSMARLMVIFFIGQFFALFLPMAVGTEAVRWYKVTRGKQGKSFFLAVTAYERILFVLTMIGFGLIPLLFDHGTPGITVLRDRLIPLALGAGTILMGGWLYLFNAKVQSVTNRFLKKTLHLKESSRLYLLMNNLELKDRSWKLLGLLFFLTVCWQIFYIVRIYFLFFAMGLSFGIVQAAWMGSLVLMIQVLPVTFAGLGLREGAYAYLFTLYGLPSEQGVVVGLLFFTQMLVFAFIGGILNLLEK
ncbi:MAG: lysylphosphatidylglycerol synthase transmembrane domain-containing protein [Thermodesulfobacteriota bacterium]